MEQMQSQAPSFESVWALLKETEQERKASEQAREASRADFDRILRESEQAREASRADFERRMREAEQERKASHAEIDRLLKESEQERKASRADFERRMQETERLLQKTSREIRELNLTVGGMGNSDGAFAEEYFFNSFENGKQNFFGEKFDDISKQLKNKWQGVEDEFDIVLYNHSSVAIIEVKYKARESDIPKVLKKADNFRMLFSQYKDFKVYLGLASLSFYPELEQQCIEHGIAVIKQVGEAVVINDTNLKTF